MNSYKETRPYNYYGQENNGHENMSVDFDTKDTNRTFWGWCNRNTWFLWFFLAGVKFLKIARLADMQFVGIEFNAVAVYFWALFLILAYRTLKYLSK